MIPRAERWGHGGDVGAAIYGRDARPRSAPAGPGGDERWGLGGHFGAPI